MDRERRLAQRGNVRVFRARKVDHQPPAADRLRAAMAEAVAAHQAYQHARTMRQIAGAR